MTIEIIENLDGSLTKIEKVGDSVTSYMPVFAGVKKSRTLEDGTAEEYEPYAELLVEAAENSWPIIKKVKSLEEKLGELKAERDMRLASESFVEIPQKGVLGVSTEMHIISLAASASKGADKHWKMVDGSWQLLTGVELTQAYNAIMAKQEQIWEDYRLAEEALRAAG